MEHPSLLPHLFRTEYRKIVAVLCRYFGLEQLEIAEDITSDTFLDAAQSWPLKGIPPNPAAWLYSVAKNKAKNYLERNSLFEQKIAPGIRQDKSDRVEEDIDLSPRNITDSQLQMMFAICHPSIPPEAQVGLSLRILCGFGIQEVADAFLTSKETINKRLFRAKEKLREEKVHIAFPPQEEIERRLGRVLHTIYLLFSEGYYSGSQDAVLRKDLCIEAIRLCTMLVENESTDKPAVNALLSLMYFHASRFDARVGRDGEPVLYEDQDTARWDTDLVARGAYFLKQSARGEQLSRYHLEAAIAYWNTQRNDTGEKWESVLQLCNLLLQVEYSPVAALNRTYALSKVKGKQAAIAEAEKLNLVNNHFYYTLLGELYTGIDDRKAKEHFVRAMELARTQAERQLIGRKMEGLL